MIHNILFDMGGVVLRFDPDLFVARLGLDAADSAILKREVFRSVEWIQLDRGILTDDEALPIMLSRIPQRLHGAAEELVRHWDEPRLPMPGAYELVQELVSKGYHVYLLTNASLRHKEYWPKQPVAPLFGDHVFLSADWKLLKPDGRAVLSGIISERRDEIVLAAEKAGYRVLSTRDSEDWSALLVALR